MQASEGVEVVNCAGRRWGDRPARGFVSSAGFFCLVLLAALVPGRARADEVKLENGDVLHGEVLGGDAENLKFKHAFGADMLVPWKNVTSVSTDKPVRLQTMDDTVLMGKLGPGPGPRTATISPDAAKGPSGPSTVSFDRLVSLNDYEDVVWNGRIALGATISDGNTRSKTLFGSVDGERLSKKDRIELHAYYAYGTSEHILSTKKGFARAQYSYYFWRPFYGYAGGAFEFDHLQSLYLRSRGGGGLGWAVIESKDLVARVEAGAEYVNEDWADPIPDDRFLSLRFAGHVEWQPVSFLRLGEDFEILPSTKQLRNFTSRSLSSANFSVWKGFGLAAIIIWQHVELPPAGFLRDDTTYILTLTYVF